MSDVSGTGWSRRQMIAAGTAGLLSATAAAPSRAAAHGSSGSADGTPEQIHLTWGDDPTSAVVVSWASAGQAVRPRVRIGQRVIAAAECSCTDARGDAAWWTYHALVDGLRPSATYGYAVTADNDSSAADPFSATFSTAPAGRARFRFTSFGDLAPNPAQAGAYGQAAYAAGAVEAFQPLFHLINGDAYADAPLTPEGQPQDWRDFGGNVQASAANRPWMPVTASHEPDPGSRAQRLASYLTRYALPSNGVDGLEGRWYSFRVGTALFVCLSGDGTAGQDGAQTRWLEAALAAARGDASLDWIVVQLHESASTQAPGGDGSGLVVRREWLPLFDRYEVDLVVSGHDHGYERSFPVRGYGTEAVDARGGAAGGTGWPRPVTTVDSGVFDTSQGTVHLVLGCGGSAVPAGGGRAEAPWSARRDTSTGYGIAVFDVNPGSEAGGQTSVTVRYYHADGSDAAQPSQASQPTAQPGTPAGDYTLFDTFTLIRPRSDGRRWHLKE